MPNKTSFPVFLTTIPRESAFGITTSPVLVSRQSLILSFTTTYLPTPLLILPMLSVVSFLSVSTMLMLQCSYSSLWCYFLSIYLNCFSDEIQSLIRKLKNNSAAITSQMLKHTASSISPILCSIFNLSLSTGRIPDTLKLSRVVPGDPHAVIN